MEPETHSSSVRSPLNQALNAAIRSIVDSGELVRLYEKYMHIPPRLIPGCEDCGGWIEEVPKGSLLEVILERGALRFGYVSGAPYVFQEGEEWVGLDYEMGLRMVELIGGRYSIPGFRAEWVEKEVTAAGDPEAAKLQTLYDGLLAGEYDAVLSGQMILEMANDEPEWTCPTSALFTGIYYSGLDRLHSELAPIRSTDRQAFLDCVGGMRDREFKFVSVDNPGPSPSTAAHLVADILAAGGLATLDIVTVPQAKEALLTRTHHFAVGDSIANSYLCTLDAFQGMNLDIPGKEGGNSLPLAAITLDATSLFFDPRWARLLKGATYPYDPGLAARGGEIVVETEVERTNDLARFLEIAAWSSYPVGVLLNANPDDATLTFWEDDVFAWDEKTSAFHAPPRFLANLSRCRDRGGLLVAMLANTVQEDGETFRVTNWLVFDRRRDCVHRIDPQGTAKPHLDRAIRSFLESQGIGGRYLSPEDSVSSYRQLVSRVELPMGHAPAKVKYIVWSIWLLYCRLFFSEASHDDLFKAVYLRLTSGLDATEVVDLLLNVYVELTLDANNHTFGSVDYLIAYPSAKDLWRYAPLVPARTAQVS